MGLKRRAFLQQSAVVLASLGVSQVGLSTLATQYQQALAQPARRKLALLVGINHYPESVSDRTPAWGSALNGCLTDVWLQQELLVSRFGFQPSDVLTVTDEQATREGIEAAFLDHLTRQVHPGDIVVVHFSGLGSRVKVVDSAAPTQIVEYNSFVPIDGVLPTEENPVINDLLEDTIALLLRSLSTDQIVTVFDVGYGQPLDQIEGGTLRLRSRPATPTGTLRGDAIERQELLLTNLKLTRKQLQAQITTIPAFTQMPGLVLAAAHPGQAVVEGQWQGFNAGLFTYALTQYLWRSTPDTTLKTALSRVDGMVSQVMGDRQQPWIAGLKASEKSLLPYYSTPVWPMGADGVVQAIDADNKTIKIWLAGMPAPLLGSYEVNSLLTIERQADPSAETAADPELLVQVRSQDGLLLKVRPVSSESLRLAQILQPGQPIREYVRVLPRNVGLTVALDNSLERVERVDATSAFAAIPGVSSVVGGEQPADCLFGKIDTSADSLTASLPSEPGAIADTPSNPQPINTRKGYGLFYLGHTAMPNTMTNSDEAVKTAVNRLTPKLHTLLSTKLLRLTENSGSSRLGVRAVLEMVTPQERILAQQETSRAPWELPQGRLTELFTSTGEVPVLEAGSHIQYRLQNYSDRPVYFLLLGLDTVGNAVAFYPTAAILDSSSMGFQQVLNTSVIPAGEIVTLPQSNLAPAWVIQGPTGIAETYVIFSRRPLTQSFTILAEIIRATNRSRRSSQLSQPLAVAQAVLEDIHNASQPLPPTVDIPDDSFALDVNAWATFNFVYRIAEATA